MASDAAPGKSAVSVLLLVAACLEDAKQEPTALSNASVEHPGSAGGQQWRHFRSTGTRSTATGSHFGANMLGRLSGRDFGGCLLFV